ncbi:DUF5691 domain-containing protein [Nocardioides speluncae]|uniref:DUF5691 domain-containing protein n=1 Tax=Nocardioides speluncae TaxID=2670337 RepID=UPI000D69F25C|nr:DUF5691 domain-containing protein [Nocardioides speluncae]
MSSIDTWWTGLRTAALVGTNRRPPPPLPDFGILPRVDARAEEALLDAAALGAAIRRSGVRAATERGPTEPAPEENQPEAPPAAGSLLELLLTQMAAGGRQRLLLVGHWCREAAVADRRAPHRLLPQLLELATVEQSMRAVAAGVAGERGRWLGSLNAEWDWLTTSGPAVADDDWRVLPLDARVGRLTRLRTDDPAAARDLIRSTWSVDGAGHRKAQLETVRIGLSPDDEELLEQALDDRAASVRELAAALLDGLPESARAERMAARLRPLIQATGLLKRDLEIGLPGEPDATGVRDGLGRPPGGRSKRGWWLEQIVAGAPLEVWAELSRGGPSAVVSRITDAEVLRGLHRAVLARRDDTWAKALLERSWDGQLLALLPQPERERLARAQLSTGRGLRQLGIVLTAVPQPWGSRFSVAVVDRLADDDQADMAFRHLFDELAAGLHPDALARLEQWRQRPNGIPRPAASLLKFRSLKRSITEAFR